MQCHKVRMPTKRPDRNVVPYPGIVFEAIFQTFGNAQLTACLEAGCAESGVIAKWAPLAHCLIQHRMGHDFLARQILRPLWGCLWSAF